MEESLNLVEFQYSAKISLKSEREKITVFSDIYDKKIYLRHTPSCESNWMKLFLFQLLKEEETK